MGVKKSNFDYCLYTFGNGKDTIYLLIFVDDLLICGRNKEKIQNIKKLLSEIFKMKDLGKIKEYLGITVEYEFRKCEIKLSQTKYIE